MSDLLRVVIFVVASGVLIAVVWLILSDVKSDAWSDIDVDRAFRRFDAELRGTTGRSEGVRDCDTRLPLGTHPTAAPRSP